MILPPALESQAGWSDLDDPGPDQRFDAIAFDILEHPPAGGLAEIGAERSGHLNQGNLPVVFGGQAVKFTRLFGAVHQQEFQFIAGEGSLLGQIKGGLDPDCPAAQHRHFSARLPVAGEDIPGLDHQGQINPGDRRYDRFPAGSQDQDFGTLEFQQPAIDGRIHPDLDTAYGQLPLQVIGEDEKFTPPGRAAGQMQLAAQP